METDGLNYYNNSANAWICPGKDSYFNNEIILKQFERLFNMLQFKSEFVNHDFEILVDNATTHTSKLYDVNLIGKSHGTNCPYKKIEWLEQNEMKFVDCFDSNGESKGLLSIAKELDIIESEVESKNIFLNDLRVKVSKHVAFENTSKLENIASIYGVKIVWCPKFHCELNPK